MDINLGDQDGYALCGVIRRNPAWTDLPILMLTANALPEHVEASRAAGADTHLTKPISAAALIAAAPDLLAACELLEDDISTWMSLRSEQRVALAHALDKARGEK